MLTHPPPSKDEETRHNAIAINWQHCTAIQEVLPKCPYWIRAKEEICARPIYPTTIFRFPLGQNYAQSSHKVGTLRYLGLRWFHNNRPGWDAWILPRFRCDFFSIYVEYVRLHRNRCKFTFLFFRITSLRIFMVEYLLFLLQSLIGLM